MLQGIVSWLEQIAGTVPLPLFVLIGGLTEELIAPIPSPLVSSLAGSIAAAQNLGILSLLGICALASFAKTLGAWPFYILGDKLEHLAISRFGKYIGVRHEDLESFGRHFKGTWKDEIILVVLRAIPVMPSTPVSVVCGILKIRLRTFLGATFVGFYLRNLLFMALGYTGLATLGSIMDGVDSAESAVKILLLVGGVGTLGFLYWKRHTLHPGEWLKSRKVSGNVGTEEVKG